MIGEEPPSDAEQERDIKSKQFANRQRRDFLPAIGTAAQAIRGQYVRGRGYRDAP